jgi:hypothetical protein
VLCPGGNSNGDDVWVRALRWSSGVLDGSAAAVPLPRWASDRAGDQRAPYIAPITSGAALAFAWTDYGAGLSSDVVLEISPTPIARIP